MAAPDGQVVCAAARWAPGGRPLGEVVRGGLPLPAVLKIVRGSCGGLGVPSLPHPSLQPTVMLVSAGRRRQIIAQAVKLRPGRGPVAVGPRLAIPETYAGWFELLSEEGRAGRCVESVAELSRRPCPCLVREPLRAILAKQDPHAPIADGSRTLAVGETISPGEEVSLPGGSNHPRGRYLTCATGRGDTVLLSLEQRGRFSPLAKEHNISGAHSARTLLAKRLPLTVRLLHGPPPRPRKGAPAPHFTPELRLLAAYEEEQVFAYPLQKETASLVAVPLSAPLKVLRPRNEEVLHSLPEFARLSEKCMALLGEVQDRIQVLDGKVADGRTWRGVPFGVPFLRRSASSDSANLSPRHRQQQQDENRQPQPNLAASSPRLSTTTPDEYDEIDQIYDYVRGFAPLPKSVSTGSAASPPTTPPVPPPVPPPASTSSSPPATPTTAPPLLSKPEPPPIETIPTKKVNGKVHALNGGLGHGHLQLRELQLREQPPQKAEKRSRHKEEKASGAGRSSGRLYLKHGARSHGPHPAHGPQAHEAHAQQLSVRYKSLSNIHGAMELDSPSAVVQCVAAPPGNGVVLGAAGAGAGVGTLDSSHSGGRTSGDSGPGNKLPEKRSRKLSRPRSLTNLVWEVRGAAPATKLDAVHQPAHRSKLSISGHKRLGTLYL